MARLSSLKISNAEISSHEGSEFDSQLPREKRPAVIRVQHEDPVVRQYLYWTSCRSWMVLLLGSLQYYNRELTRKRHSGHEIHTKYTFPQWLSTRTLDMRLDNLFGWQTNLRTYRTLSCTHGFFGYAAKGDVDGLRKMISTKQAFVTDRESEHGQTALHVSTLKSTVELHLLIPLSSPDCCKKRSPRCLSTAAWRGG